MDQSSQYDIQVAGLTVTSMSSHDTHASPIDDMKVIV